jgi:DNA-nicking Smr family endonuclease
MDTLDDRGRNPGEAETMELPIDGSLDLHTFHPREVKGIVREYVKVCRDKGILDLRIIHGKGTGQLRRTVHSVLATIEGVESFHLANETGGGWGATLVKLKP